jgi:hypothetical protein
VQLDVLLLLCKDNVLQNGHDVLCMAMAWSLTVPDKVTFHGQKHHDPALHGNAWWEC